MCVFFCFISFRFGTFNFGVILCFGNISGGIKKQFAAHSDDDYQDDDDDDKRRQR